MDFEFCFVELHQIWGNYLNKLKFPKAQMKFEFNVIWTYKDRLANYDNTGVSCLF